MINLKQGSEAQRLWLLIIDIWQSDNLNRKPLTSDIVNKFEKKEKKMQIFTITLLIGLSVAEKLPAPYPPSGWRPNGAILHLPPEYSPQRLRQPIVEIRKENVQYAGQLGETTTSLPNDYLPPSATETATTEYSEVCGIQFGFNFVNFSRTHRK